MVLIGREHITQYVQRFPSAKTALAMWQAITGREVWRNQAQTVACYPTVKFLMPQIACFYPMGLSCVVTTQIAFNTGVLIVLAVSDAAATTTTRP